MSEKGAIILNKMYAGSYLQNNIGHEVINLFKADNGKNYIYVNEDGITSEKDNKAVLLVRYVEEGVLEVIAKAEVMENGNVYEFCKNKDDDEARRKVKQYIDDNNITYGGVKLYKLWDNDKYPYLITFEVDLKKVKEPVYLIEPVEKKEKGKINKCDMYEKEGKKVVFLSAPEKHFKGQGLKRYYTLRGEPKAYQELSGFIDNQEYWEKENTTKRLNPAEYSDLEEHDNFLSMIKKEYDELVFSNLLAYFFEKDKHLFSKFALEILDTKDFGNQFEIVRESNDNIDIWIESEKKVLVIENKIKSKINGERHDLEGEKVQSQLDDYYKYAQKYASERDKTFSCFIFLPDYNRLDISKYEAGTNYTIIPYSKIYDFYFRYAGEMIYINYFPEFLDALKRHSMTIDNSNFEDMKRKFISTIKGIREFGTNI